MADNMVTITQTEYEDLKASARLTGQYETVLTNLVNRVGIVNRDTIAAELIPRGLLLGLFNDPGNG